MKRVYQAADLVDAELMADHLREVMIPVEIFNQHSGSGFGELPATYPEVWVKRDADHAKARALVLGFQQSKLQPRADRLCAHCQESSPASFEFCWHCQQPL